ncbi:MAG: hypothetical protein EZS28_028917 [Streblomastix strix]|uniref:Uncharacterized protein n=1 Tax=Streblomastix strix TaxID=222440 RepID=A0A5J4UYV0_9EUKA|nr:MAG: hypothetical protein EZS28_028917 [Streblomastix strix]
MWSNEPSFEKWKKNRKNPRQQKQVGVEEDINGDNFPEFVVRDDKGFIHSADGLRIAVPINHQRVTNISLKIQLDKTELLLIIKHGKKKINQQMVIDISLKNIYLHT